MNINNNMNIPFFTSTTSTNTNTNTKTNEERLKFLTIDAAQYLKDSKNFDVCYFHKYPFNVLCNFYPSNFKFDGAEINSMEGFIQALKVDDPKLQKQVCKMFGPSSKKIGNYYKYYKNFDRKTLYWNGKKYNRYSDEYKKLLAQAYEAKYRDDKDFRDVLQLSEGYNLTHKIGKTDPHETILTEDEYMDQLNMLCKHNKKIKIPIDKIVTTYATQPHTFNKLKDLEKLNIKNLYLLDDKIICGNPITKGDNKQFLSQIKQSGIKTIIDLNSNEDNDKKALCKKYGFNYFSIPLNDYKNRTKEVMKKMPEFINYMKNSTNYIECEKSLEDANIAMCANYLFNDEAYLGNAIMFPQKTTESKKKLIKEIEDFAQITKPNNQHLEEKLQVLKDINELEYFEK